MDKSEISGKGEISLIGGNPSSSTPLIPPILSKSEISEKSEIGLISEKLSSVPLIPPITLITPIKLMTRSRERELLNEEMGCA